MPAESGESLEQQPLQNVVIPNKQNDSQVSFLSPHSIEYSNPEKL